ncbi:hypothetical protein Bca52824_024631 [Brassica carinata]|uniref:Uncharacterized protein n=1 Tax=Brassica carinata TaxID=52824 RepID=A0A8X8ATZ0_BRACI|nr:hypothetical protein Bca52824_024631 [Brassica carinata]
MSHDGKRCPDLEKERAHVSKYGYKDRNFRQQDVLRGELSPYNGQGKAPKQPHASKYQNVVKAPVNRKLFAEKEVSPKAKQGRSSDKAGVETTKSWVVKSFGDKATKSTKEPEKRITHESLMWKSRKQCQTQGKLQTRERSLTTNSHRNLFRKVRKPHLFAARS